MPIFDEVVQEDIIHSRRSDGASLVAIKTHKTAAGPLWEVLTIDKNGRIASDGMITLDENKPAVYRQTLTIKQLRTFAHDRGYI